MSLPSHSGRTVLLSTLLLAFGTLPAAGQTTFASITGTVTDAQGSVIGNVQIEATHVASNYKYSAVSNSPATIPWPSYVKASTRFERPLRASANSTLKIFAW